MSIFVGKLFDLQQSYIKKASQNTEIMKKTAATLLILFTIVKANAQTFYLQGGANFANISISNDGKTKSSNTLVTFNAGAMGTFGISKIIDIETGLLFTGRGAKSDYFYGTNNYIKTKFNPYYIEVPVNLLVKFPLDKSSHLFVNAGPYVAVGVAGKSKVETRFLGVVSNSEEQIKFNNDNPTTTAQEDAAYNKLKRFDYGLNFGGGFAFKQLIIKANYDLGLTKINSTETNNSANDKNKYRTASISIGIPIGN